MRLIAGWFALTLMSSLAFADEPALSNASPQPSPVSAAYPASARASVGLRVVRVLPETRQALLFDRDRGTHVLASVGSTIGAYRVEAIEGDAVTLTGPGREVVLAAPDSRWRQRRGLEGETPRRIVATTPAPADPYGPGAAEAAVAPVDPYADAPAPLDPYSAEPVRIVAAPTAITPGEGGVRVASAAPTSETIAIPTSEPTSTPASEPASTPASAAAATASPTTVVLPRAEVSSALADFAVLTRAVRGEFTPKGARIDTVALGSVFAKAGLRAGDLVTAVDGLPLRSIDDAADLYLRAPATKTTTIELVRDGKPLTLRLAIQ